MNCAREKEDYHPMSPQIDGHCQRQVSHSLYVLIPLHLIYLQVLLFPQAMIHIWLALRIVMEKRPLDLMISGRETGSLL